ncbi:MAG: hypothetical protein IPL27_19735 [Lewinellaceae bacterium]|nr:hypothetical protein [Lewinellaceae bacterium]
MLDAKFQRQVARVGRLVFFRYGIQVRCVKCGATVAHSFAGHEVAEALEKLFRADFSLAFKDFFEGFEPLFLFIFPVFLYLDISHVVWIKSEQMQVSGMFGIKNSKHARWVLPRKNSILPEYTGQWEEFRKIYHIYRCQVAFTFACGLFLFVK